MYTISEVLARIQANPNGIAIAAMLVYAFGFLQYFTAMAVQRRERRSPWFFWQHAWYFGHDLTFVLLFHQWFYEVDFWVFKLLWVGCVAFVFIELVTLAFTVRYERDELWGKYAAGSVSVRAAWIRGLAGFALGFALFWLIRIAIGDPMCLALMMSTNFMVAVFPLLLVQERQSRWGSSVLLGIFVIGGTLFTFSPPGIGFWTSAAVVFDQPWFYSLGVIAVGGSIWYVIAQLRYPRKVATGDLRPVF